MSHVGLLKEQATEISCSHTYAFESWRISEKVEVIKPGALSLSWRKVRIVSATPWKGAEHEVIDLQIIGLPPLDAALPKHEFVIQPGGDMAI